MKAKFFQVGGSVRDELLGKKSKDIDYTVVALSYDAMKSAILERGGEIFLETPQFLTIRAKVPVLGACDYVLARRDGSYSVDGRRPDFVEPGDLEDDLARRDFTVNALAKDEDGTLIDLHGGREDLACNLLRCVGNTQKRMTEDSLRMLRAIRFALTKGFALAPELESFLLAGDSADLLGNISIERIREELQRCFQFDTLETLRTLEKFWRIRNHIFSRNLRLTPTVFVVS